MKKTLKRSMLVAGAALLGLPAVAAAQIMGHCADCHTMHNSEQNAAVAVVGLARTVSTTPIQNLLRMDCVACHAQGGATKIAASLGGSKIPQVYHTDATGDLAAGNFKHIELGNRKGHNVADLFPGGDLTGGTYLMPPGKYRGGVTGDVHSDVWNDGVTPFGKFTCAGTAGCHGTRAQLLSHVTNGDGSTTAVRRTGIAAISGAHHNNQDGAKTPLQNVQGEHSGVQVANSYRFIPGLKGYGNTVDRWQNASPTSHNEYFAAISKDITSCGDCHIEGSIPGITARMSPDSTLKVHNQSMSGFCATCHGNFHSSGFTQGKSGAFLRHPSDYVIPAKTEYAAYQSYNLTAPPARADVRTAASDTVQPNTDMVMCLSCHQAHATTHDYMLRFDYAAATTQMRAGDSTKVGANAEGCLACHTTKGVAPANR
jgi:hypothetical protein